MMGLVSIEAVSNKLLLETVKDGLTISVQNVEMLCFTSSSPIPANNVDHEDGGEYP